MKQLLYALLAFSLATIWLFNFTSGIVGGLWLIISGGLSLVIIGVILSIAMPFAYSIAMLPSFLFLWLLQKLVEGGNKILSLPLMLLLSGYNNLLMVIWVAYIFNYFMYEQNLPILALWIFGYSVVMGPIGYMAKNEGPDAGAGTTFGVLFAQISYLALTLNYILGGSIESGYMWLIVLLIAYTLVLTLIGVSYIPDKNIANHIEKENFHCQNCGAEVPIIAVFCKHCGSKLATT